MNMHNTREVLLFSHASSEQLFSAILPIPERRTLSDLTRAALELAREEKANLSGVDLTEENLSELDLSGLKLNKAQFHSTNLSGARLMEARLSKADFKGASLAGADLSGADLRHARLAGVDL